MERFALDLMTLEKMGAWAITEPDSRLGRARRHAHDARGATATTTSSTARRRGSRTAPTPTRSCCYAKLDDGCGGRCATRPVLTFILDPRTWRAWCGPRRCARWASTRSPTGELLLRDVRVGRDRLLGGTEDPEGGGRESARDNFVAERAGVAAMSLGIIEECLRLSIDYAKHAPLWERRSPTTS